LNNSRSPAAKSTASSLDEKLAPTPRSRPALSDSPQKTSSEKAKTITWYDLVRRLEWVRRRALLGTLSYPADKVIIKNTIKMGASPSIKRYKLQRATGAP
jgi:hypothetical protein